MAKITKEQIQKINNKCSNNWKLDTEYYIFHNEKTLIKNIELDEENYLQFALRYNYKNQITLNISKYHHKEGDYFATSSGLGKSKLIDETSATRKNVNNLIELTKDFTNEELKRINAETDVTRTPLFEASEMF